MTTSGKWVAQGNRVTYFLLPRMVVKHGAQQAEVRWLASPTLYSLPSTPGFDSVSRSLTACPSPNLRVNQLSMSDCREARSTPEPASSHPWATGSVSSNAERPVKLRMAKLSSQLRGQSRGPSLLFPRSAGSSTSTWTFVQTYSAREERLPPDGSPNTANAGKNQANCASASSRACRPGVAEAAGAGPG